MKDEVHFRWQIKWGRGWITTSHHCTEEQIRKEHPEAIAEQDTRLVRQVPETSEEMDEAMSRQSTGAGMGRRERADGTPMKWWESE